MHASCDMLRLSKDFPRRLPRQACGYSWDISIHWATSILGGGLKYFLFSALFGEDSHFDSWLIFFKWVGSTTNQPYLSTRNLLRSTSICGSDFYLAPEVIKQEDQQGGITCVAKVSCKKMQQLLFKQKNLCDLSNFKGTRSDWTCHSKCLFIFDQQIPRPWLSALEICPTLKTGTYLDGVRHEFGSHHQSTASHGNVVVGCVAQSLHGVLPEGSPNFTPENSCAEEELPGTYKLCGLKKRRVGIVRVSKVKKGDATIWFGNSVTLYNNFESPLQESIKQVLQSVVGPGDLLSSDIRADFAAEAYAAWGRLPRMHQGEACGAAQ